MSSIDNSWRRHQPRPSNHPYISMERLWDFFKHEWTNTGFCDDLVRYLILSYPWLRIGRIKLFNTEADKNGSFYFNLEYAGKFFKVTLLFEWTNAGFIIRNIRGKKCTT